MQKFRRRVILAKPETIYGTDSVPTGAANAIRCSEPTIRPLEGGTADRQLLYPELGASPKIHVGSHQVVEFGTELAGAGAAGTAPKWGVLAKPCGVAETLTALTDAQYDPASGAVDSDSLYFNIDGTLHKLAGARGNGRIILPRNDVPRTMWTFTGLWADPAAVALPVVDFTGWIDPIVVSNANTPTFTLHGVEAVMASFELDFGNQVVHRDLVNSESVIITNRASTGRIQIEAPDLATKNFFTQAKGDILDDLQIVHGLTAGNIIQIDAPKVQIDTVAYAESDGIAMLDLGVTFCRDTGDDEWKITVK